MGFFFVLIYILLAICLILLWQRRKVYLLGWKLNSDLWSFPFIGHGYLFLGSDEARMKGYQLIGKNAVKYGGLSTFWMGSRLFVVVVDPKNIELVLKLSLAKDDIMDISHEIFGHGSIFAPVPIWRPRRKVIAPTFSVKNLNQFASIFYNQSVTAVEQLQEKAGKGPFSLWLYLTTYTMDSVCESTLGVKIDAQRNRNQPFLNAFQEYCEFASFRLVQPPLVQKLVKYLPVYKKYVKPVPVMHQFVDKIVEDKRNQINADRNKSFDQEEEKLKTFLELYVESSGGNKGFTNLELREETLVLLLAGTDTSAVGAAFTCLMLAMHPDVQEKAYEEIREIFGDSDRPLTHEDLPRLKYLELIVKESLRLYPPVPVIVRKVDKPFQLTNGLTLHSGTSILVNIWTAHRNPHYWGEDADVFRPERFIDALPEHPNAFIPFSGGPRSCLGYQYAMMSMKTVLSTILRRYKILPASPEQEKHTLLRVKFDVMMKDVNNFEVKLENRT